MSHPSAQQQSAPMLINLPPPPSNPDTPTEMPGTPTSTTTSLSALSTTAIKDGHRGHGHPHGLGGARGHHHNPSTNSLEAERADRISRLTGLGVSGLRAPAQLYHPNTSASPQPTATSTGLLAQEFAANPPAYFDSNGQPTAATKMSTVGTASATGSVGARTTTEGGEQFDGDGDATEEDVMSTDTNYRAMDIDSTSGAIDPMDEDLTNRSVGGFEDREDRMSDDGNASLVGFGEGANSTVSGPIYHRRPLPGTAGATGAWGLERSSSNLSETVLARNRERVEFAAGSDTPVSASAAAERRDAKYVDGVALDGGGHVGTTDDDMFVDTTTRGPIPLPVQQPGQPQTSALREGVGGPATREAAERIVRERLDGGEGRVGAGGDALGNPKGGEKQLGRFYFEEKK
ncbi:hypothetical protein DL768_002409 [Monosporascus sp. mg162]|nr:hypothetical protein DL768_002409 [Monosporascus sp. mg162]